MTKHWRNENTYYLIYDSAGSSTAEHTADNRGVGGSNPLQPTLICKNMKNL